MTHTIIPTHPKPPARKPTIDEIICAYLVKFHHINIKPVSSNVSPSAGTNALMGAIGPDAVYANTMVTQQSKAARLQEWLHMKTFALNQPDFVAYRDQCFEKYEAGVREFEKKKEKYLEQLRSPEVQAELTRRRKISNRLCGVVGLCVAALAVAQLAVTGITNFLDAQRAKSVSPELINR